MRDKQSEGLFVNAKRLAPSLFRAVTLLLVASCGHAGTNDAKDTKSPAMVDGTAPPVSALDAATRFLSGIPRCPSLPAVFSTREAREQPEGTMVAVRGVLVHNPKWHCPAKACATKAADGPRASGAAGRPAACCNTCDTPWFVVDAADAARPYMSRARFYMKESGQTQLLGLEAQDCDVVKVNAATPPKAVIVTGTFSGAAGEGGGSQLIEGVRLCVP